MILNKIFKFIHGTKLKVIKNFLINIHQIVTSLTFLNFLSTPKILLIIFSSLKMKSGNFLPATFERINNLCFKF